ncbi:family 43 glycosylhydrolase [Luteolibacter flavescens]|uniref:Family 43 glycosylhydrolase n=1 Tax=Luteolibacter flavescens TaxID=1859460 RepID=A0ABT3FTZ0_9BACT|nr:family 43 glycosylhydrolase [Luteolibacter flavescens]MCW1887053.1 family 43 glycosylhydrolase [Luteolibacter flavescens]
MPAPVVTTMRLCLALLLLISPLAANPVMDGADPHVIAVGKNYWMYPTESRSRRPVFAAYRSTDLRTWHREGTILELDKVPWVKEDGAPWHGAWAPAMAEKKGRYYFYYSVGPQNPTPSRIGVAVGNSPSGPFKDSGKPLLTGGDGFEAIDPMVFTDPANRKSWFYAGGSAGSKLRVFEMADDMVSFKREVEIEQPKHFTEAPFMHVHERTYYLSYSHGRWNDSSYSVHYATGKSPSGPWEYRGQILSSDEKHQGPGHHAFVQDPATKDWFIVYHRWETSRKEPPFRGTRKIAVEKIEYDAKGLIRPIKMSDGRAR